MKKITALNLGSLSLFLLLQILLTGAVAFAFQAGGGEGCAAGECKDCHKLETKEVATMLKLPESNILRLDFSDVPGLWEVEILAQGKTIPIFVDFSKKYVIQGRVFPVKAPDEAKKDTAPKIVDVSKIPVDDALLLGRPDAKRKIIVFDDPECSFCAKLQPELKAVVEAHPNIAFLIKMYPLIKIHPTAYEKARAIACSKSLPMLEDSLAGKPVPPPLCEAGQVKSNLELGRELGIVSTPTLIMPDGRVVPGSKKAEDIVKILNGEEVKPEA
jgi:thiol:disulfide interchange protein DsbC